jgi:hypothetical protein
MLQSSSQREEFFFSFIKTMLLGVTAHGCTPEAKIGGSRVRGQPGLHSDILSQKTNLSTN